MLTRLAITNLALIQSQDLTFTPGFTVLTGETGAGKSLLLDALGLALGDRADAGLIRHGETTCDITAEFTLPLTQDLQNILETQGVTAESPLTLRRQLKREEGGKAASRAWVNGTPVPASVLAQLADNLWDLHSQHATHQLFKPSAQQDLVDDLAGLHPQREVMAKAHRHWQQLTRQTEDTRHKLTTLSTHAELTQEWLAELETLAYQPGEMDTLLDQRRRAGSSQQLAGQLDMADQALSADRGAVTALRSSAKAIQSAAKLMGEEEAAPLDALATRAYELLNQLEDLSHDLARQSSAISGEELNVEAIDDRLHALRAAARKHRVDVTELPEVLARLQSETTDLHTLATQLDDLTRQLTQAGSNLAAAAQALSQARRAAFPQLEQALTTALKDLHLPHARLVIQLTSQAAPTATGSESVELLFTANPGQPPQPLGKVASGGELSRAMLALKSVLFQALSPRTVVLDEVDTGLSGPTAAAIGRAMAKLSTRHQVLAITHHPQVAAAAQAHLRISKRQDATPLRQNATDVQHDSATITTVEALSAHARQEELARLLAGAAITPEARAAAAALLNENNQLNAA